MAHTSTSHSFLLSSYLTEILCTNAVGIKNVNNDAFLCVDLERKKKRNFFDIGELKVTSLTKVHANLFNEMDFCKIQLLTAS